MNSTIVFMVMNHRMEAQITYVVVYSNKNKNTQHIHNIKIPIAHSSNKESVTENLETQYRSKALNDTRNAFRIQSNVSEFLRNPRR